MKAFHGALCILLLAVARTQARAQDYKTEAFTAEAPQPIAQAVRAVLSQQAVRVSGKDGALLEVWLRGPVVVRARPADALGVAYSQFAPGTLIGAVRVIAPARDYRNRQIAPGVYTLRYAVHPVDGNHMGVSPQRDFLLFVSPSDDASLDTIPFDKLLALGRRASGSSHPVVWSLPAAEGQEASAPSLVNHADEAQWLLSTSLTVVLENGRKAQLPITIVIVGHAPEA